MIGTRSSGKLGMPDLSLIRLPPPRLDPAILRLLLGHPTVVAGIVGSLSLVAAAFVLSGAAQQMVVLIIKLAIAAHALEAVIAYYIAARELHLSPGDACAWAALILAIGLPCSRWLLKLRPPSSIKAKQS